MTRIFSAEKVAAEAGVSSERVDWLVGIGVLNVRDLATGIDLVFTPLGSVGLRGVPGEWELFEASIR